MVRDCLSVDWSGTENVFQSLVCWEIQLVNKVDKGCKGKFDWSATRMAGSDDPTSLLFVLAVWVLPPNCGVFLWNWLSRRLEAEATLRAQVPKFGAMQ